MAKSDYRKYFGAAVAMQRKTQRLSQEKLAEMAGLHRTYIGSVERGERNISLDNIYRLAAALKVNGSEILAMAEQMQAKH